MIAAIIGVVLFLGLFTSVYAQDESITVNATVPVKLGFTPTVITPGGTPQPLYSQTPVAAPAATVAGIDIGAILKDTTFATIITGIGAYLLKRRQTVENRANASADTTVDTVESLKSTDYGVRSLTKLVAKLAQNQPDENLKQQALKEAERWDKDVREYYETDKPIAQQFSKDTVVQKLAVAKKQLEPTTTPDDKDDD